MKRILWLSLAFAAACAARTEKAPTIPAAAATRRTIVIDAEATGVVEPINIVEVKSKASGLITRMPVETGVLVKPGDLLVQIDTRDVQNQYDQAKADYDASRAKLAVSESQKKRSDDLFKARVITAQEHESASLDFESSKANLVRTTAALDLAKQRLEDATVVAPVAGTVIEKDVSLGQVITSATNSFGGGTTIIKMADLNQVRVRALFNETDIGQVRAGQVSTVTVDAYPDRRFQGLVEKIEPQAVVQQNVTMFPVLVNLDNREGLLKPGMNGEISVLVDERPQVIAIPNDAVKSVREAAATATMLRLNVDSVQADVRAQFTAMGGGNGFGGGFNGRRGNGGTSGNGGTTRGTARGDVALEGSARATPAGSASQPAPDGQQPQAQQPTGQQQRRAAAAGQPAASGQGGFQGGGWQQGPEVSDKDCAAVKAAFAKKPGMQQKLDDLRTRMRNQELDFQAAREEMMKIYSDVGVDGRVAGACARRERMAAGGGAPGFAGQAGAPAVAQARTGAAGAATAGAASQRSPARPGLVFVVSGSSYKPRVVMLGASNLDYTEVVSGLKEGEQVALLGSLALQAQRQQMTDRMRQAQGVPGLNSPGGGARAGGPRGR